MTSREKSDLLKQLQKAIKVFPKVVKEKGRRYKARQKFLKEVFGDVARMLVRDQRRRQAKP